ncbi:hypothetical protein BDW62DRAFT_212051 [Aspergillus aurantiobrunneus]
MAPAASLIESLPNELLDEIIHHLSSPPPSSNRLHHPPSAHLTKYPNRDLKNLSLTCSRLLDLVRPRLFSHGCLEPKDANEYLSFVSKSELGRYVTSVVVNGNNAFDGCGGFGLPWWRRFLCSLTPQRLTVIAPPSVIGELFGMKVPQEHSWAFEIPNQIVQLECDWRNCKPILASDECCSLLDCLPWSSMLFNESSSLKAYNHYEYFLYQVPSLFHRWSAWASTQSPTERPRLAFSLGNLTTFTYVAVFPFYNHVQLVLDAVEFMTNLRSLKIQLGPSQNNRVTELEQRCSMDPSDPWMELATGYSLIAHAVRNLGRKSRLSSFTACDYEMESVRAEIDVILGDILCDGLWVHDGHGTWNKRPIDGIDEGLSTATFIRLPSVGSHPEPAYPILAHSLLQPAASTEDCPEIDSATGHARPEPGLSDNWDLKLDIEKGLHSPGNIFRPGTVIGFSRLRGRSPDGNDDELIGDLPRHLLTKWLRYTPQSQQITPNPARQNSPRTFIIHPPNSTIFSPPKLLASLLSHQPPLSRNRAISLLDSVQLFPVFDFAAAVQAINEVSDTLHTLREDQQQQQQETVLIIAGLDTFTEAVVRASNAVRGTAVLTSALRTLTQLSRIHRLHLSVLLVNTSGVGPTVRDDADGVYPVPQTQPRPQTQAQRHDELQGRDDGIQSIFCIMDSPLFPSLLMKTLDQGIDTHLLVSDTRRVPVVEVVKDRVGSGLGKWCIWDANR